ncbi:hypothetical protein BpHYR1_023301 [Brachionus plicatilis]|uniref:Uncharacterized protein n=1 Tax=Brachionus plicatilis TaxID=10195 RepID=A0A3M7P5E8_BRAPC|nr:hypothetical protein BpHYR1_023301 [Brachionus plicatilis]
MNDFFGLKPRINIDFDFPFSLIGLFQQQTIPSSLGINLRLEELHTLLAERYEAEISNTSGNLTTKKDDNCWISS